MNPLQKIALTIITGVATSACAFYLINWIFEGTILNTAPVICVSGLPGIIAAIYTYKNLPEMKED